MKNVRVNAGNVGLVFRKDSYKRVLTEGAYWLMPNEKIVMYNMAKPFVPPVELNILLKDEALAALLTVVKVADNEIALRYQDGVFSGIMTAGKYAFWKGVIDYTFTMVNLAVKEIPAGFDLNLLQKTELVSYVRAYVVESYEKGVMFVDGKFDKVLDAGMYFFWKNAIPVTVMKADLRQLQLEVSGQEILTRDKAALRVNFYAQYKVTDVVKAIVNCKDYEKQLYILMQLALREYIGMFSLDELLENKESVSENIMKTISISAARLGVEISACGIRDIILPGEVKEIMNQVLIAEKKAQANIITRREETASTRSLLNTAKLMEDNAMLFKLKEMEYVEKIADKINTISLSGGNQILDQLRDIFSSGK
jgi:regulator of protease activity HflC (stomatin/prohibitin superfamily)